MKKKILSGFDYIIKRYHSLKPISDQTINIKDSQLFFMTGYDKSGTTWIKKAVNYIDDFSCLGSNQFFDFFPTERTINDFSRFLVEMKNIDNPFHINKDTLIDFYKNTYKKRIFDTSPRSNLYFGEKSTVQNLETIKYFFPESKQIVLVRDMRDIIVSFAFHFDRKYKLNKWSRKNSKFDEDGNIKINFITRETAKLKSYYRHLCDYRETQNVMFIRYEDLNSSDGIDYFTDIINFITNNNSQKYKDSIVKSWNEHTFEKLSDGRQKGEKDTGSFFRSGKSGDYVNHLTQEQIKYIDKELDKYLAEFNYK